jgi:predicted permease
VGAMGAILCTLSGLLMLFLVIAFIHLEPVQISYLLLFSVIPPALLNYMVAERFQQEPQQVAAIVLMGNMLSLLIIPLALFFIF